MVGRFKFYWKTWLNKGAAKMDHKLWLFWSMTG